MIKNYFKTAIRSLIRQKLYVLINLIGLTIGMTVCIVLFLFIQYETAYDRFQKNSDRIYRVISQDEGDGEKDTFIFTPAPLAPALIQDFPEVEKAVRFSDSEVEIISEGRRFHEKVFYADAEIFEVFSLPLKQGDPEKVLQDPRSLLISESMGKKYFGDRDPVGQVLSFYGRWDYIITGVFQDIPMNTHIRFDFLGSFQNNHSRHQNEWGISNYYTYILLSKNASIKSLENKIPAFIDKYKGKDARSIYKFNYLFQALTDIHLESHWRGEITSGTKMGTLYIFSAIALFILLIACFNSINLSFARYTNRAREVGMRKVIGANRIQLIQQFLSESVLITLIALPATLALVEIILPFLNSLFGKNIQMGLTHNLTLLLFVTGVLLFTSIASGLYPAFFIASFQPVSALKTTNRSGLNVSLFRKSLIVIQFVASLIFIISALVISDQLHFLRTKKMGFKKDQVVLIPINEPDILNRYETVKKEFKQNPHILAATTTSFFPGEQTFRQNYWKEGMSENQYPMIQWLAVDHDFISTFQIQLKTGRDFNHTFANDVGKAYILNESAASELGWDDISSLDKSFKLAEKGNIIGVVKDFNFRSLHQGIEPLVLYIWPKSLKYFAVRLDPQNLQTGIQHLQNVWNNIAVKQPFEYFFLNEQLDDLYKTEKKLGQIFGYVTGLSIFIACLGLFGLASFTVEGRTKEIGIRKILGASVTRVIWLLSRDFAVWILLANILAWPIAFFSMNEWLQNFAYRKNPSIWIFILSASLILFIALVTVCIRSMRAATTDPIKVLRYE